MEDEHHLATDNRIVADFETLATQFFDVAMNPIAGMFCTLLSIQVSKGLITKNEAKAVIASSVDLLNQRPYSDQTMNIGRDMLIRMIGAIDGIPDRPAS